MRSMFRLPTTATDGVSSTSGTASFWYWPLTIVPWGARAPVRSLREMSTPGPRARVAFGDRPRAPRPVVLTIVFGILLAIVGVTATSQAVMVSVYASSSALQATVESDLATVRGFVYEGL